MLQLIEISRLNPHPQNPRADLGDLSELAESIKQDGIRQNLTVVPSDMDGWERHGDVAKHKYAGDFTIIIGHRRCAAAEAAGLTEVLCHIDTMDEAKQLATMLTENMLRTDLTRFEEAQGIQLMLDLGENITSIAEKTSFSRSKVTSRVKLLSLDKEKFKAAEARGATLEDYAELDKISDPGLKNEALDAIGTPNFKWAVKSAVDKEKSAAKRVELLEWLQSFAEEIPRDDDIDASLRIVRWMSAGTARDMPDDTETVNYFFQDDGLSIKLLREILAHEAEANSSKAEAQERRNEIKARLEEISERAYEMRRQFIREFNSKKCAAEIAIFAARSILLTGHSWSVRHRFAELMNLALDGNDEDFDDCEINNVVFAAPEKALLVAAYANGMDGDNYSFQYFDHGGKHKESPGLDRIYAFLAQIGYEMSDEEEAMQDGTHHLFAQGNDA